MSKKELRGPELLRQAVNEIIANPASWNQKEWHCNTSHCVFGWCEMKAGGPTENTFYNVIELLGISEIEGRCLSSGRRTLPEIYQYTKVLLAGYNRAGYDRDGYDRDGYNWDGEKLELVPL